MMYDFKMERVFFYRQFSSDQIIGNTVEVAVDIDEAVFVHVCLCEHAAVQWNPFWQKLRLLAGKRCACRCATALFDTLVHHHCLLSQNGLRVSQSLETLNTTIGFSPQNLNTTFDCTFLMAAVRVREPRCIPVIRT